MTSPDDVCPVCDSKINRGSQTCDVCGADLSILGSGSKSVFVCPECGNELLEQDTKCPKCGVEFSSQTGSVPDDNVIFECPVCNAQVPSDANRCPSCGVEFLSEDDAAVAEDVPKSVESVPPVEPAAPPDLSEFAFDREPSTPEQVIDEVEQSFSNKSPGAGAPPKGPDENESRLTESVAPAREKSETAFSETVNPPAVSSAGKENAPERGAERERKSRFSLFRGGRRKKEPRGVSQENAAVPPKESLLQADNAGPVGSQPSPSSSPSPGNSMSAALFDAASMRSTVERIREVLKFAGSVSAEITQGKQYLDKALELLQKGSNTEAEKYVKLAKTSIEESIQGYFSERIEIMRKQVEIENFGQERKKFLEMKIRDVATLSKSGQYGEAQAIVKQFQSELSARASQYGEAQEMIGNLEE
ncbi:MAG: zinc ribbon domain-containing protein, partial [Thermoplasmata archaeon]|nr:zinc ribbon domain-containing protein [Candidatus Sysuiplasma superficiale]